MLNSFTHCVNGVVFIPACSNQFLTGKIINIKDQKENIILAYFRENFSRYAAPETVGVRDDSIVERPRRGRPRAVSVPITPQDSWRARCIFQGCILHLKDAFSTSVAVHLSIQESREEIGFKISDSSESWTTRIMR